jgi:alkylation response protein AidB-like acyl-CoA dehydrogenase
MDFSLSDEQALLADSVERFVQHDYPFEARREQVLSETGFSADHWRTFAELGWLGVPFPVEDGGFGGGAVELMILMERFGRGLVIEPYLASIVLAGGALRIAGSPAQKRAHLGGLVDGSRQAALAFAEPQARYDPALVSTVARRAGSGYVLSGQKCVVLNAPAADFLVVSARHEAGTDRPSLFLVATDAPGLSRVDYPTVDGFRAADLTFDDVAVAADALLGEPGAGLAVLEQVLDEAILAVGAEAVGCMEVLYQTTVEYCRTRKQFGQPIGSFQALQHRMVDMFMEHEQSKSLMYMATMRMEEGYGAAAKKAASAFKVQVGKSGRCVAQGAVQLHGGMGMTDELAVGHYFKRLTAIDALFGNVDYHLKRYGSL